MIAKRKTSFSGGPCVMLMTKGSNKCKEGYEPYGNNAHNMTLYKKKRLFLLDLDLWG